MGFYGMLWDLPSGFIKHGWKISNSMEDFMGKSLKNDPFSLAMFDYRRTKKKTGLPVSQVVPS